MTKPARFCTADDCTNDALDNGRCEDHSPGPPIARLLTAQQTAQRRSEQATSQGPRIVTLCAEAGCPRAAVYGPYCGEHRSYHQPFEPAAAVAFNLNRDQIAALRQQVEADAAPIFVIAMNWIARQRLAHLGVSLDSLEASMTRIRAELGAPT